MPILIDASSITFSAVPGPQDLGPTNQPSSYDGIKQTITPQNPAAQTSLKIGATPIGYTMDGGYLHAFNYVNGLGSMPYEQADTALYNSGGLTTPPQYGASFIRMQPIAGIMAGTTNSAFVLGAFRLTNGQAIFKGSAGDNINAYQGADSSTTFYPNYNSSIPTTNSTKFPFAASGSGPITVALTTDLSEDAISGRYSPVASAPDRANSGFFSGTNTSRNSSQPTGSIMQGMQTPTANYYMPWASETKTNFGPSINPQAPQIFATDSNTGNALRQGYGGGARWVPSGHVHYWGSAGGTPSVNQINRFGVKFPTSNYTNITTAVTVNQSPQANPYGGASGADRLIALSPPSAGVPSNMMMVGGGVPTPSTTVPQRGITRYPTASVTTIADGSPLGPFQAVPTPQIPRHPNRMVAESSSSHLIYYGGLSPQQFNQRFTYVLPYASFNTASVSYQGTMWEDAAQAVSGIRYPKTQGFSNKV
tara:strand:- start:3458 stop:4891 length:1434 start_codon:yes stop_codon:yes gene_type:complete